MEIWAGEGGCSVLSNSAVPAGSPLDGFWAGAPMGVDSQSSAGAGETDCPVLTQQLSVSWFYIYPLRLRRPHPGRDRPPPPPPPPDVVRESGGSLCDVIQRMS